MARRPSKKSMDERAKFFWTKIDKSYPDGCWPWIGALSDNGYGRFWDGSRNTRAHRFSYRLHYGEIQGDMEIHHQCENKLCCNPNHLIAIPPGEHRDVHLAQIAIVF